MRGAVIPLIAMAAAVLPALASAADRMPLGAQCEYTSPKRTLEVPVALGAERFLQRVNVMQAWGMGHGFMFVDCAAVDGVGIGEMSFARGTKRDPYKVSSQTSVDDLKALASERRELLEVFDRNTNFDGSRYDPFCGCALLYPKSEGADYVRVKPGQGQ